MKQILLKSLISLAFTLCFILSFSGVGFAQSPELSFPTTNGVVYAIAYDATYVYIGGNFTEVDGEALQGIARINKATGAVDATWKPAVTIYPFNQAIHSIVCANSKVYIAGNFLTNITDTVVIAVLDAGTGEIDNTARSWTIDEFVYDIAIKGDYLYIGGNFSILHYSFVERLGRLQISNWSIDEAWITTPDNDVNTLCVIGNYLYVGGMFNNIDGSARAKVARFNVSTSTPSLDTWTQTVNGEVNILATQDAIAYPYVGGAFSTIPFLIDLCQNYYICT